MRIPQRKIITNVKENNDTNNYNFKLDLKRIEKFQLRELKRIEIKKFK